MIEEMAWTYREYAESSKKSSRKFSESEGGVTCHATCVDWDAPKTKTFKTLAQCKRWMETTADEIASEWGSMVEGLAVWAEDDELIVISGNGKVVAKFKIVPDYEDFHDPDEYYQESDKKFGRKFKESYTDMSAIEEKLATALDEAIRTMTPDDIQGVYESAKNEMAVSTIFVLLQQAFASRKFTDEEKKKILNSDPKLISQMVLDIIDRSLPQSKGALVLVLGMAREAVKEMSDQDWKDIVEYALNNPDNL